MAGGGSGTERELDQTATWAVSIICAIIVVISIALEKVLHFFGHVCLYVFHVFICLHSINYVIWLDSYTCISVRFVLLNLNV